MSGNGIGAAGVGLVLSEKPIVPRRLVVNADDLGLTVGVNDGIFDAHDRGIVTSASVFANASATPDAIARSRSRPSLGVGVHLALVDGAPTLPPARVPTLVHGDRRFPASWKPFIVRCLQGRVALNEVERELAAQVDRIRSEGLRVTHLDAHKHIHAFPPVFTIVVRLAVRFRIPVVRVPYERWSPVWGNQWQRHVARRQSLLNLAMLPWALRNYRIAAAHGIRTPHFTGRTHTGVMSIEAIVATIRRLPPGVTELMVHPGHIDHALRQMPTRLVSSRAQEVRLLCSPALRTVLPTQRVQLVRHDGVASTGSISKEPS
jgi:chitin disaccharide deacetylase